MVLFIGNLSKLTTEKELRAMLSDHGAIIRLKILLDKVTWRSRGVAYAEMPETDALTAISRLNGTRFMQNEIVVSTASARQLAQVVWK